MATAAAGGTTDARLRGVSCALSYASPKTGSPAPGAARYKALDATHQSGRGRVLLEAPNGDAFEVPLQPGGFTVSDRFVGHGKLSISVHTRELRCLVALAGGDPTELRLFATCVRAGTRLDVRVRERARAAAAAAATAATSYSVLGGAAALAPPPSAAAATGTRQASFTIESVGRAAPDAAAAPLSSSAATAAAPPPTLSSEQQAVVAAALAGRSIFFTGSAGTGKSAVLHALRLALPAATTAFTASTAVAACHVAGTTLHAFAGITASDLAGLADGSVALAAVVANVRRRKDAVARWRRTRTLVVDEVSMLSACDFDALEGVARGVREDARPFGGLQLVLSGDFAQLPPVGSSSGNRSKSGGAWAPPDRDAELAESGARYCFAARAWPRCVSACLELTRVFRQSDRAFIDLLNEMRWGRVGDEGVELLRSRWGASAVIGALGDVIPTKLHTHRATVDGENRAQLARLPGPPVVHRATDTFAPTLGPTSGPALLDASCPAPRELTLKVGAQVMLTRTLDQAAGLVNGARGVVTRLSGGGAQLPSVRFLNGTEVTLGLDRFTVENGGRLLAVRRQLPLDLAWAISIHKSQGQSLDAVEVDLSKTFEWGQAYVALSRARTLGGLVLVARFEPGCVRAHPAVLAFYTRVRESKGVGSSAAPAAAATAGAAGLSAGGLAVAGGALSSRARAASVSGSIGSSSCRSSVASSTADATASVSSQRPPAGALGVALAASSGAPDRMPITGQPTRDPRGQRIGGHATEPSLASQPTTAGGPRVGVAPTSAAAVAVAAQPRGAARCLSPHGTVPPPMPLDSVQGSGGGGPMPPSVTAPASAARQRSPVTQQQQQQQKRLPLAASQPRAHAQPPAAPSSPGKPQSSGGRGSGGITIPTTPPAPATPPPRGSSLASPQRLHALPSATPSAAVAAGAVRSAAGARADGASSSRPARWAPAAAAATGSASAAAWPSAAPTGSAAVHVSGVAAVAPAGAAAASARVSHVARRSRAAAFAGSPPKPQSAGGGSPTAGSAPLDVSELELRSPPAKAAALVGSPLVAGAVGGSALRRRRHRAGAAPAALSGSAAGRCSGGGGGGLPSSPPGRFAGGDARGHCSGGGTPGGMAGSSTRSSPLPPVESPEGGWRRRPQRCVGGSDEHGDGCDGGSRGAGGLLAAFAQAAS